MNIKEVIKKYQTLYKDDEVIQKGSWISINGKSYRVYEVEVLIDAYKQPEPEPIPESYETLLTTIREYGREIFESNDLKEMQRKGLQIAKIAKRVLNLMEKK
jgi:hypothetical protein